MSYLRRIRVSEIMNEHVVTGRPDDSLSKIASQMERHKIGSVVIVQNRRVVGILTERDFTRIAKQGILQGRDRAKHHMIKPVFTARSDSCGRSHQTDEKEVCETYSCTGQNPQTRRHS